MNWTCPNCKTSLVRDNSRWYCVNGHHFDQAKQGYVNLLLANDKKSKDPGDNKPMVVARRQFLAQGYYQPLVPELKDMMGMGAAVAPEGQWLDVGCGEGYYSASLVQHWPNIHWSGIDISKEAIKMAAKKAGTATFAVASSFALPLETASCDGLLQIFAPAADEQLLRVLKPNGYLLRVSPGPKHLFELKQAIYADACSSKSAQVPEGLELVQSKTLAYSIELKQSEQVAHLIEMTPFQWTGNVAAKQALIQGGPFKASVEFLIKMFKKRSF